MIVVRCKILYIYQAKFVNKNPTHSALKEYRIAAYN